MDDEVFKALADPSRRALLDSLNVRSGQTLRELCAGLAMARQSVSKHLAALEGAGLVTTMWRGREKLHYLDAAPINAIAERWISRFDRQRARALTDLATALEQQTMSEKSKGDNAFVYTTYIATTPERLWQALTEPAFTERYWGVRFDTDWQVGSTITWVFRGVPIEHPDQVVVAAEPGRRLAYTFHTFTPEFGEAVGLDVEQLAALAAERRSTVAFDIEALDGKVKLTVVHDGFEPGSTVREMIGGGWPELLANLKTLLETGDTMPAEAAEREPVGRA